MIGERAGVSIVSYTIKRCSTPWFSMESPKVEGRVQGICWLDNRSLPLHNYTSNSTNPRRKRHIRPCTTRILLVRLTIFFNSTHYIFPLITLTLGRWQIQSSNTTSILLWNKSLTLVLIIFCILIGLQLGNFRVDGQYLCQEMKTPSHRYHYSTSSTLGDFSDHDTICVVHHIRLVDDLSFDC